MPLKEELEILRGEPIEVFTGDPMDIPCIETSDPEKLCKHPVVSVDMITYNHEPYIRQAIEGVMMQKTDFEFELVIGEDASQDKTREICFEYQKKYPDKIRVLWWHENVSKLGGNGRRTRAHCRGEFIALCEGDDYWIDPLKLQKQVDVMRKHPNVGFCFCGARVFKESDSQVINWNSEGVWSSGVVSGKVFLLKNILGLYPSERVFPSSTFIMTASVMLRVSARKNAAEAYDIFSWRLHIGDSVLWLGLASVADAYFLPDVVSVYNCHSTGICSTNPAGVVLDTVVVKLYYYIVSLRLLIWRLPIRNLSGVVQSVLFFMFAQRTYLQQISIMVRMLGTKLGRGLLLRWSTIPICVAVAIFGVRHAFRKWTYRYYKYIINAENPPMWLIAEYGGYGISCARTNSDNLIWRISNGMKKKFRARSRS